MGDRRHLVVCSKSSWEPTIRREHALAELAGRAGIRVTFVERPRDIRATLTPRQARAWGKGFKAHPSSETDGLDVVAMSVVAPGHRDRFSERSSAWLLARALRAVGRLEDAVIVGTVPWQWPAIAAVRAGRKVFDAADDWCEQIPSRRRRLLELYGRIDQESDAVTVASATMAGRFRRVPTTVVANGVAEELLVAPTPCPLARRMVCAGTLSPRFDAPLVAEVLDAAPDWSLDLYGQCQYPGHGERAGPELRQLLATHRGRVTYHGVVPRERLAGVIDRAAVAAVFNRRRLSLGQDSMKLYDYAARGRPVVSTKFTTTLTDDGPPHLRVAETAREFADALEATLVEPSPWASERRTWAEEQRWQRRWPKWAESIFGAQGVGRHE